MALQGLPALEDLLYGPGAETLAKPGGEAPFRCQFAASIAGGLRALTGAIAGDWQDGGAAAKSYLAPGPGNQTYPRRKR